MANNEELLQQGIAAAKAGKREEARALLLKVIEADERNEHAWVWMAGVVDDVEEQRICLENVLELNPNNANAQRGLAWLNKQHPPATVADSPAATASQPEVPTTGRSSSGEVTRQLSYDGETPLAMRPKDPVPPEPTPPPVEEEKEYPCPYCGAPTFLGHQACPACRRPLTVRQDPPPQRKITTTILGILWAIGGVILVLTGIAVLCGGIFMVSQISSQVGSEVPILVWPILAIPLLIGGFYIIMARSLLRRKQWAYILNAIFASLSVIGVICNIAQMAAVMTNIPQMVSEIEASAGPLPEGVDLGNIATSIAASIGVILFVDVALVAVHILLVVLSFRDFYPKKARLLPELGANDDVDLYNAGVAFRNEGMWYMAMTAWEGAARMRPKDANYRHALGLAYAQLNRFEQALPALQEAYTLAPDDVRIQESIALVEKRAASARR